jgi:hypothetical protein
MKKLGVLVVTGGFLCAVPVLVVAETPIAGWATQTHYRDAETTVQKQIQAAALAVVGQPSPLSQIVNSSATSGCDSRGYCTDTAGGDGTRMFNAIVIYYTWRMNPGSTMLGTTESKMVDALVSQSGYWKATAQTFVDANIIPKIEAAIKTGVGPSIWFPHDNNGILRFLAIRQQCIEFAIRLATANGGQPKGFHSTGVASPAEYRPGMGLYWPDYPHAMIIVDINWDANGNPTLLKVVESNWQKGWQNPNGGRPWARIIDERSTSITAPKGSHLVVSYE